MDSKTHFTVSISKEVLKNFYKTSAKKSINKSLLIENFLKNWTLENKEICEDDNIVCKQHYAAYNSSVKGDH